MFNHPELLRIPGPTPIPPQVQQAMNEVMFGHRSEDAKNLLQEIRDSLPKIFGTTEEVIVLSGSGTSALEAAVVNSVSEGDEVLEIGRASCRVRVEVMVMEGLDSEKEA